MKLWDKGTTVDAAVERFTVGNDREMDARLAVWDVVASIAHVRMLGETGLISASDADALADALRTLHREFSDSRVRIPDTYEDVHSWIEALLTERLGEAGRRVHTARSRNDQVLVAIRLWLRDALHGIARDADRLAHTLLALGARHRDVLLPGYTHLQVAMPSSFGLWFGAYAEALADDLVQLAAACRIVDRNPLGSGAGYGSSFAIDRTRTTELLGFEGMNRSSVYAQMTRGKVERVAAQSAGAVAATLAKLAADVCLYASQNFGFVRLPDAFTTGSSLMPHKRNPDVFELIRARCNRVQSAAGEIALVTANLPSGYHRDMQVLKEVLFPAIDIVADCLAMTDAALAQIEIRTGIMDDPVYRDAFSVVAVQRRVAAGEPFRDAYRAVAAELADGSFEVPGAAAYTHEGSIGDPGLDEIAAQLASVMGGFRFEEAERAVASLLA